LRWPNPIQPKNRMSSMLDRTASANGAVSLGAAAVTYQ
jgi:hypothetical protein